MPDELYEIIALATRYWFLLLMLLIVWRSFRWYSRDRKQYKKRLKLLPDAGYIGELVVVRGDDTMKKGACFPVSHEGVLGYLRSNDVCVPVDGIANRHLWYAFDDFDGLQVEPFRGQSVVADGRELVGRRMRAFLAHGSVLEVGQAKFRLRMFSGFEHAGEQVAQRESAGQADESGIPEELEDAAHSDPVRRMHEIAAWQNMLEEEEAEEAEQEFYPPETDEDGGVLLPEDEEDAGLPPEDEDALDGELDDSPVFYPPETDDEGIDADLPPEYRAEPDGEPGDSPVFYPPEMDGDDDVLPPQDGDGEDLKSLYVEEDEAAYAKRVLWDKYFRGRNRR